MPQIRSFRLPPRRCASASEILSPVYSAIFLREGKLAVEKQPLPLISDLPIARPCARLSLTSLNREAPRDGVRLITYAVELVAHPREVQNIYCSVVRL